MTVSGLRATPDVSRMPRNRHPLAGCTGLNRFDVCSLHASKSRRSELELIAQERLLEGRKRVLAV